MKKHLATLVVLLFIVVTDPLHAQGSYPEGSTRLLTAKDLSGLDVRQLKIMRNEIFARYGYIFQTPDMKTHFAQQSWYKPLHSDVSSMLSPVEKSNVDFIKKAEAMPVKASTLQYKGKIIDSIVTYFNDYFNGRAQEYIVIYYQDELKSWEIYPVQIEVPLQKKRRKKEEDWDAEFERSAKYKSGLTPEKLITAISGAAILVGDKEPPTLYKSDQESGFDVVDWNGKTRNLNNDAYSEYWADYRISLGGRRSEDKPVMLPSENSPGRVGTIRVKSIIDTSNPDGILFFDDKGIARCITSSGSDSGFTFTLPRNPRGSFKIVDSDRFVVRESDGNLMRLLIYSSSHPEGIIIPVEPDISVESVSCSCDSDWEKYADAFYLERTDQNGFKEVRYVYILSTDMLYKLPPGSSVEEHDRSLLRIKGLGLLFICCSNSDLYSAGENGEAQESLSIDLLDTYRVR
jgi:hypothetical protein